MHQDRQLTTLLGAIFVLSLSAGSAYAGDQGIFCPAPDALEDNDDCASAVPAPLGLTENLNITGFFSLLGFDEDYYTVSLNDGQTLNVDLFFHNIPVVGDIDLYLYDDPGGCHDESSYLVSGFTGNDDESVEWTNTTGGTVDYIIVVEGWYGAFACNSYDMSVEVSGVCDGTDDYMEENDHCDELAEISDGLWEGLEVYGGHGYGDDPDFYSYVVPTGGIFTVDLLFTHSDEHNLSMFLYDDPGTCVCVIGSSFSFTDNEQVSVHNQTGEPLGVSFVVFNSGYGDCSEYALDVRCEFPCTIPDWYEENDSCAQAASIGDGGHMGLTIGSPTSTGAHDGDNDFYAIPVPSGQTIDVDIYFETDVADLDLWLWDSAQSPCGEANGGHLRRSWTSSDDESLSWTNNTGSSVDAVIEVRAWDEGDQDCNNYDMYVSRGALPPPLPELAVPFCLGDGTDRVVCPCGNYTTAEVQPSGCEHSKPGGNSGARIEAEGVASVADDIDGTPSLSLAVRNGYPNEFGMFVSGTSRSHAGSIGTNGALCISPDGDLNRYFAAPATPFQLDEMGNGDNVAAGFSMAQADNENLPATTVPGATLYYQFWYRDAPSLNGGPCGTSSNLSSGVSVLWGV